MKKLFTQKTIYAKSGYCFVLLFATLFSAFQAKAGSGSATTSKAELMKESFLMANKKVVVGGNISLDFVAAAPFTYNHHIGGGAFDDRTIGKSNDVVESLEGGDFKCNDIVSYLTKITVSSTVSNPNNKDIILDYSFLAAATGQPGVALGQITNVKVNYGRIENATATGYIGERTILGLTGYDAAIVDDFTAGTDPTGSTAQLIGPGAGPQYWAIENENGLAAGIQPGVLFDKPAYLNGKVKVTDLEAGETIVVRVDVRIMCDDFPISPTGNLAGYIVNGRVDGLSGNSGKIAMGNQTVPFKNIDQLEPGTCTLIPDYDNKCEGEIQHYTLTTNGIPTWSLTGDGVFTDASGNPSANPGTALEAYVKATAPSGLTGSYTVHVDVNSIVDPTSCEDIVNVYKNAEQPTVIIHDGVSSLCDANASSLPSVEVCSPVDGLTYVIEYGEKDINGHYTKTASNTYDASDPTDNPLIFENLDAGFGFRIRATNGGNCPSAWTDCTTSSYIVESCQAPDARLSTPNKPQPAIGKVEIKDLSAYPVPFSESVTVEFKASKAENYVINLYDLQGHLIREIKSGNAKAGEIIKVEVSGSGMADSMYLVRKVSKSGISTVKLLKKE